MPEKCSHCIWSYTPEGDETHCLALNKQAVRVSTERCDGVFKENVELSKIEDSDDEE